MKKLSVALLSIVCFSFTAFSQQSTLTAPQYKIDSVTKKITYTEVIDQQGIKDTLYNRAIHWCGTFFKNLQNVSTMDKPNGKVGGKYTITVYDKPDKDSIKVPVGKINFKFSIEIKENKYRYKITDFERQATPAFPLEKWVDKTDSGYKPEWEYFFAQVDKYIQDFIKSMKKGMQEAVKASDEW